MVYAQIFKRHDQGRMETNRSVWRQTEKNLSKGKPLKSATRKKIHPLPSFWLRLLSRFKQKSAVASGSLPVDFIFVFLSPGFRVWKILWKLPIVLRFVEFNMLLFDTFRVISLWALLIKTCFCDLRKQFLSLSLHERVHHSGSLYLASFSHSSTQAVDMTQY